MRLGGWQSGDDEKRRLRVKVATLERAHHQQKEKSLKLVVENKALRRALKAAGEKIAKLATEKKAAEKQRDRYRAMIFKKNVQPEEVAEEQANQQPSCLPKKEKLKRGGQKGHRGQSRKKPEQVDEVKRVYLSRCPDCGATLPRSHDFHSHTVEDIPPLEEIKRQTTRYDVEWQWCCQCRKKVRGQPSGIIPGCRLGINLLLFVLLQKYGAKNSWATITFNLQALYGIKVSEGALVGMVHRTRRWLGTSYNNLLNEIRGSPVKHADETSWRVNGSNHWLWGFFTAKCAYYVVEESRGKGIPQAILAGSHDQDVLVRDDYAAYAKLPLRQQSCWAHLLRKSREAATDSQASPTIIALHLSLKNMFAKLQSAINQPYRQTERVIAYDTFKRELETIISNRYYPKDAKEIQTRITNQNTNLITALLSRDVPLTNNLAERQLRPLVVIRKISGGSRSLDGAKTQAINMSIFQSLRLQQKPLISSLKNIILSNALQ